MYIVIKQNKSEHLKEKLHKAKELVAEILECYEEAAEERREHDEDEYRDRARRDYDDYDDDRYMARGRGGRGRGGRY